MSYVVFSVTHETCLPFVVNIDKYTYMYIYIYIYIYIYQSMIYQVMKTVARELHTCCKCVGSRSVVNHYSFMKATKHIMTLLSIKNRTDIVDRAGFILLEK